MKLFLLREIFAKNISRYGDYHSDFERVFREAFPTVHQFVRWINSGPYISRKKNHATLICTLQRLESFVVIEQAAPRLVDRVPFVPLHDALYSRTQDIPLVKDAFAETFEDLGLPLRVKIELAEKQSPTEHEVCVMKGEDTTI